MGSSALDIQGKCIVDEFLLWHKLILTTTFIIACFFFFAIYVIN
jgi:hypothetical protein